MNKPKTQPVDGVAEVDFNGEPFLTDYKKTYADMHASGCPFAHSSSGDHYAIGSHKGLMGVLKDHKVYKNKFGVGLQYGTIGRDVLISVDPPEHSKEVRVIAGSFSLAYFKSLRPDIEAFVNDEIDKWQADGEVEFHSNLSVKLPLFLVFKMMGLSMTDEDGTDRTSWVRETLTTGFSFFLIPQAELEAMLASGVSRPDESESYLRVNKLFLDHVNDCREGLKTGKYQSESNIVTRFLTIPGPDGDLLSEDKLLGFMNFLLAAGSATTTILLSNVINRLLTEEGVYERLRANPELREQVIEETLRIDAPVHGLFRTNAEETQLGPIQMEEDTKLLLLFGAAGLDPEVYDDPQTFSLDRELSKVKRHLAFGYGTHFCRGAPLARLEADVMLEIVMKRLPNLRLTQPPVPDKSVPAMMGIKELHLAWDVE